MAPGPVRGAADDLRAEPVQDGAPARQAERAAEPLGGQAQFTPQLAHRRGEEPVGGGPQGLRGQPVPVRPERPGPGDEGREGPGRFDRLQVDADAGQPRGLAERRAHGVGERGGQQYVGALPYGVHDARGEPGHERAGHAHHAGHGHGRADRSGQSLSGRGSELLARVHGQGAQAEPVGRNRALEAAVRRDRHLVSRGTQPRPQSGVGGDVTPGPCGHDEYAHDS